MNKTLKLSIWIVVSVLVTTVVAFFAITTVRFLWHRPVYVRGDSMEPTLAADSLHYVNAADRPQAGQIAVFYYVPDLGPAPTDFMNANAYWRSMPIWGLRIPAQQSEADLLIKRVVATGGDTVELRAETVEGVNFVYLYRNGARVEEDIVMLNRDDLNPATIAYAQRLYEQYGAKSSHGVSPTPPYTVPDGCCYVLGDNRDDSTDSRHFPFVAVPNEYFVGVLVR